MKSIAKAGRRYNATASRRGGHSFAPSTRSAGSKHMCIDGGESSPSFVKRDGGHGGHLPRSRTPSARRFPRCATALDEADTALCASGSRRAQSTDQLPPIEGLLAAGVTALLHVDDLLREHSLTKDGYFGDDARSLYSDVRHAGPQPSGTGEQLARSTTTRAVREKLLLLTGSGRRREDAPVVRTSPAEGSPTDFRRSFFLAQDFDGPIAPATDR